MSKSMRTAGHRLAVSVLCKGSLSAPRIALKPRDASAVKRARSEIAAAAAERQPHDIDRGWRRAVRTPSLAEVFGSIKTRPTGPLWRKLLAFLGPGYLVAVGYMDPGNWATSLAGGSKFGYALLFIALLSNIMAIILQALCARLGVASGRDLAQACRDAFPRWVSYPLWALAESPSAPPTWPR
jgi:Natural resistance-associated macrophage protein